MNLTKNNNMFVHKYNKHGSNDELYIILIIILSVLFTFLGGWSIVEFILYLFKDHQFNWLSVWLTSILFVLNVLIIIRFILKK